MKRGHQQPRAIDTWTSHCRDLVHDTHTHDGGTERIGVKGGLCKAPYL